MFAIRVYNTEGKSAETVQVPVAIDRKEQSTKTLAHAIRVLFQNWRQGTVGCKTRGQVAFSNKKPWRQKGTGRARVSSLRSPLWRKGGIIFGPQPRVRTLDMNTKQKRLAFNNLLFSMIDNDAVYCLDFTSTEGKGQTKAAASVIKNMGLTDKKIVLFLPFGDEKSINAFRNIPRVTIVLFDQPNAYHLVNAHGWVFLKKDADLFKNMVTQWN